MFYDILDKKRTALLPLFESFKGHFYLAGGTALALQIGHRDSVDFDFFSEKSFNTKELFERLRKVFKGHTLLNIQEETNTLTVLIDDAIKVSFFTHDYLLIKNTLRDENLALASVEDIGCMKLSAITSRATNKDYIDLYFILKRIPLPDLLEKVHQKYPQLEKNLILKSLVYFDDITLEKILFRNNNEVPFEKIKETIREEVKNLKINQ